MLPLALMMATVTAIPVERINGFTSINEGDQVGEMHSTSRGDCFKCNVVSLPLIDAEARRDLAKRSPQKIKKFGKKSFIGLKKKGKKSKPFIKKGGKKSKKAFKKSSPFIKKGGKKGGKTIKKGAKFSAPFSIPAAGLGIPGAGTFAAFGAPGTAVAFDGFLGGTALDVAFDGAVGGFVG